MGPIVTAESRAAYTRHVWLGLGGLGRAKMATSRWLSLIFQTVCCTLLQSLRSVPVNWQSLLSPDICAYPSEVHRCLTKRGFFETIIFLLHFPLIRVNGSRVGCRVAQRIFSAVCKSAKPSRRVPPDRTRSDCEEKVAYEVKHRYGRLLPSMPEATFSGVVKVTYGTHSYS